MDGVLPHQGGEEPPPGVDFPAGPDVLQLELVGGHAAGEVDGVAVVFRPVLVEQPVPVGLVYRRAGDEVHTLDQGALDVVLDDEVGQLVAHARLLVVGAQDEQPPDAEAVGADVADGVDDLLPGALLVVGGEGGVVQKLDAQIQLEEAGLPEKVEHLVVEAYLVPGLYVEAVADAAVHDGPEDGHGPVPVGEEVVVGEPEIFGQPDVAPVEEADGLPDVGHHIFRRTGADAAAEVAYQGAVVAVMGAAPGGVHLGPEGAVPHHFGIIVD